MVAKVEILICGKYELIHPEVEELGKRYHIAHLESKNRQEFISDIQPSGRYGAIKAIYYTGWTIEVIGKFDEELISLLPDSLVAICQCGAGYDKVDTHAMLKKGIQLSNTPLSVDDATATTAMFLIIAALRGFTRGEMMLRRGEFDHNFVLQHDPEGKTLGIVGMGGIGRALARRALAFDMNVIYHNRNPVDEKTLKASRLLGQVEYVGDLQELLGKSDVVSLNMPLNDKTRGFFDESCFDAMKKGSVLVNTARGAVIKDEAMIKALESGKLHSVGLDVFSNEPNVPAELIKNEGITLLPHLGTSTVETNRNMELRVLHNIESVLSTGKVMNIVPELVSLVA